MVTTWHTWGINGIEQHGTHKERGASEGEGSAPDGHPHPPIPSHRGKAGYRGDHPT